MSEREEAAGTERLTPLHALHLELGAKMVGFAGWSMPVSYPAGILAEHKQCRERAALFDVSHMGQVTLRGEGAAAALERLVPSSMTTIQPGRARYTVFTDESGGILDDLIVSNAGDRLFLVVNASMREQDVTHLRSGLPGMEVAEHAERALVALQGPAAVAVVEALVPEAAALTFMSTVEAEIDGVACRLSRLGYTGEDGFEISVPAEAAETLARRLLADSRVGPAGLGARDSLRLEAGLPLYGNDLDRTTSPVEAGLGWIVQKRRREQGGFPGAERILSELAEGPPRKLVGLRPEGRAPAREGTEIESTAGEPLGRVTSGGFGPTVEGPVSLGYLPAAQAEPGTEVNLVVRGKARPARVAPLPFVPHRYKR